MGKHAIFDQVKISAGTLRTGSGTTQVLGDF